MHFFTEKVWEDMAFESNLFCCLHYGTFKWHVFVFVVIPDTVCILLCILFTTFFATAVILTFKYYLCLSEIAFVFLI